jgi:hypothetical protein
MGVCQMGGACGTAGKSCCANGPACTDGSTCMNMLCVAVAMCGANGQPCCANTPMCNNGLVCNAGNCKPQGAPTGDPCTAPADCDGNKPVCITKDSTGVMWPMGYCSSTCSTTKNDPNTRINPACPGNNGTCVGTQCETLCSAGTCRMGYSCFQSCEPTGRSQCDPTMAMSCPQDGGTGFFQPDPDGGVDDAGMPLGKDVTAPRNCARIGQDDVGRCTDGCDPLYPQSTGMPSPPCTAQQGCYPSYETGLGTCFETLNGVDEGQPCMYLNNCNPGLACRTVKNQKICRKMCGGPNMVGCPNGQTCADLTTTVKKDVLGSCD